MPRPLASGALLVLVMLGSAIAPAFAQSVKEVHKVAKQGPSALPELQRFLLNDDVKVRAEAVRGMIEIGGQRALDPLIEATRDNDPQVQILAVNGLVNFYLPGYVATGMTAPLKRIGSDIRSRFGETEGPVIEPYIVVRPNVLQAIGKVAKNGSSLDSRANAARAAGVLRAKPLIPDLIESLKSRDSDLIWNVLVAFEKMKDRSACPGIRYLIRDFDERVQVEALEANGVLNCQEARGDIRAVLAQTDKDRIRRAALSALAMMPEASDRASFATYIENDDERLRTGAAEGYARLASIDDARKLRTHFDRETRTAPRLALAFALVMDGDIATTEYAPLRYLVYALNNGNFRDNAQIYLSEAARNPEVRRALYTMLDEATRDEKLSLARVFAISGDKSSVSALEKLSHDPDSIVAQEGTRQLRNLNARI
jgi:HEAT repeat protein